MQIGFRAYICIYIYICLYVCIYISLSALVSFPINCFINQLNFFYVSVLNALHIIFIRSLGKKKKSSNVYFQKYLSNILTTIMFHIKWAESVNLLL